MAPYCDPARKRLGMAPYSCDPGIQEAEARVSTVSCQPGLQTHKHTHKQTDKPETGRQVLIKQWLWGGAGVFVVVCHVYSVFKVLGGVGRGGLSL